ncbi:hypothetical protein GCM10011579_023490 [Streptomyces albiflavescens]|uniref:Uncharacterized protein n=1 Tax=Streptomyces albiflavescens TaxID=1623582 RepID=A0A917XY92_9ACTN|nr:hypothetical protein [Streptomyces albiflavescens]GGN59291.1 hypothetical protein GCM10011579_023490 [Streptomyces albiflavescens]
MWFANDPGTVRFANDPGAVWFANDPGTVRFANDPGAVRFANDPGAVRFANDPGAVRFANDRREGVRRRYGRVLAHHPRREWSASDESRRGHPRTPATDDPFSTLTETRAASDTD